MDNAREQVWGALLLERQVVEQGHLAQLVQERDTHLQQGRDCTLGQLLVQKRWLDPTRYGVLRVEVEGRGRVCSRCNTAFLVNGRPGCPRCGSQEARGLVTDGTPPSGRHPQVQATPPSGRFPPAGSQGPPSGAYGAPTSGRFAAPQGPGYGAPGFPQPAGPGSGSFNVPHGAGSGSFNAPGYPQGPGSGSYQTGAFPQPAGPGSGSFGVPTPFGHPATGSYPGGASGSFRGSAYPQGPGSGSFNAPGGFGSGSFNAPGGVGSGGFPAQGGYSGSYAAQPGSGYPQAGFSTPASGGFPATYPNGPSGSAFDDSEELGVGKRIGRYEVVGELGRGGMGVVYKARVLDQPHRFVAIKVLLAGEFASERLKERFKAEAQICMKLRHQNIVAVHEVGEIDGLLYYSMDYVQGQELQEMIRSKSLPIRRGVEILVEVAQAAHHAHENGVVHRDLKPSNVLVGQDGAAYIMDFGLAKNLESDKGLTKSGVAIGTPYYMPPEQARGSHREMDARSDVYALGAILYEIVTRRVPFTAKTQNELLRKIIEEDPLPPRQVRAGVPQELEVIALKALGKDKDDRFSSALTMAEDMQRFLNGEPIQARPPAFWKPWVRKLRRNKSQAAIVAAALVAVALALVIVVKLRSEYLEEVARTNDKRDKEKEQQELEDAEREKKQREDEEAQRKREEVRGKLTRFLSAGQKSFAEAQGILSPNDARAPYRAALENYDRAADCEIQLDGQEQVTTRYRIAQIRRALCRWTQATESFQQVAKLGGGSHQARAHLAVGMIRLRIQADRTGALDAFKLAQVKELPERAEAETKEEQIAAKIAIGYRLYLEKGYEPARRELIDLVTRSLPAGMKADAHGALAYLEVQEGKPLGGDEHAKRGLDPSQEARSRGRSRYEFLVDRAILLARNAVKPNGGRDEKLLREADNDARDARSLDIGGEWALLALATVQAAGGQPRTKVSETLSGAVTRAGARSEQASQTVARFRERLLAALKARPTPSSGARSESFSFDFHSEKKGIVQVALLVKPGVTSIRATIGGFLGDEFDFFLVPGRLPKGVSLPQVKASTPFRAVSDASREVLFAGPPLLKPGPYTLLIERAGGKVGKLKTKLQVQFFKRGEKMPWVWRPEKGIRWSKKESLEVAQRIMAGSRDPKVLAREWPKVEATDPSNLTYVAHRAVLLFKSDQQAAGIKLATQTLGRVDPKKPDPDALVTCGSILFAAADSLDREIPRADLERLAACLKASVDVMPFYRTSWDMYSTCLVRLKQYDEVLKFAPALLKKGFSFSVALNLAKSLHAKGKTADARSLLKQALPHPDTNLRGFNGTMQFYRELGDAPAIHALADLLSRQSREVLNLFSMAFKAEAFALEKKHKEVTEIANAIIARLPADHPTVARLKELLAEVKGEKPAPRKPGGGK